MSELKFRFYPPKKQQDINLVPSSTIVGASALVAKSTAAKKKKKVGLRSDLLPPFGPTQSFGMGSDISGNFGGDGRNVGYGNTNYGARAYGEAKECIKNTSLKKFYTLYNDHLELYNSFE